MSFKPIVNMVIFAGCVQGFFLAALVLASRKKPRVKLPLAGLLAAFSVSLGHSQTVVSVLHIVLPSPGGRIVEPVQLLFGPLLYLFCRNLSSEGKAFSWIDLLHGIPFTAAVLMHIFFITPGNGVSDIPGVSVVAFQRAYVLAAITQFIGYLSLCHRAVVRWRARIGDETAQDVSADFAWLFALMAGFGFFYLASIPILFWYLHGGPAILNEALSMLAALFIFAIGFRALGAGMNRLMAVPGGPAVERYRNSPLDEASSREIFEELCAVMIRERPYADFEISLSTLAGRMGTAPYKLSQAINENSGRNFSEFINGYRVDEVKRLIAGASAPNYTLLDIAFEAGFNSKPTFNKVFKRMTGMTPSQFAGSQKK
ncbi:MAG: AraC family transcriptional regulator [Spirochaetes bacterium]|nr:MAG: AraC family transcriptional regulator [Spirochaetota bacterium]